MLLAIDIGNTNIVIGVIREDEIVFKVRIATDRTRTSDQYGVEIKNMLEAFGVHREDISLWLSGREMKVFASQGQIRTAALSMKLAQLEIFRRETGESPILLLDDVMSELDMTRRTRLLGEISGVQTFITCTDESDLEGCREKRSYRVSMTDKGTARIQEVSAGEQVEKESMDDIDFT